MCDVGDFVVNGGFLIFGFDGSGPSPETSLVEIRNNPIISPVYASGWEVLIIPAGPATLVAYDVYAICFDNPPLRP